MTNTNEQRARDVLAGACEVAGLRASATRLRAGEWPVIGSGPAIRAMLDFATPPGVASVADRLARRMGAVFVPNEPRHDPDCGLLYDDGPEECTCRPSTPDADWAGDWQGDTLSEREDSLRRPRRANDGCNWPDGGRFAFHDDPGEHDPCYVVMPGGASLPINHDAGDGVDIARAWFIINACNAALDRPVATPPAAGIEIPAPCDCAARFYGDGRWAHQLCCATFAAPTHQMGEPASNPCRLQAGQPTEGDAASQSDALRDSICQLIEAKLPRTDEATGIAIGGEVEALADAILAALASSDTLNQPKVGHVWTGDGVQGSPDGFDGPICSRCGVGDTGDTPTDCEPSPLQHRGWRIDYEPPPVPCHDFDWSATHPDFDGADDVNDNRQVFGSTLGAVRAAIDEWHAGEAR